jgi:hypothetical protein
MSGAECATYFANTARKCSANYCIGVNGDIACNVEEENRAWTSSSWDNDKNAITIECSDCDGNWNISDATFNALVELCVDICQRYGFSLSYDGTPNGSLTEHRMFANTDCPGEPFHNRFHELAEKVNARLGVSPAPAQPSADASIEELAQEVIAGAFGNGDERRAALGSNYDAVQARVNEILSGGSSAAPSVDIDALAQAVIAGQYGNGDARRNALGDNYDAVQARVNELMAQSQPTADAPASNGFAVGDTVVPTNLVDYNGNSLASYHDAYTITELVGDRAVLSVDGTVWAAMNIANIAKVGEASAPSVSYDRSISVGNRVIPCSDYDYNGTHVIKFQDTYTVSEINGDRAVLVNNNGDVWCAMHVSDLRRD